jgi:elongation factor G
VFKVTDRPRSSASWRCSACTRASAPGQTQVFIGHNKKPVKLGHVFHLQGKEHKEADAVIAGDIGAVAKIEESTPATCCTTTTRWTRSTSKPQSFPTPMYGLAVTPKARGDEQKISQQLSKLAEEDPTFKYYTDRQTHEMVMQGSASCTCGSSLKS